VNLYRSLYAALPVPLQNAGVTAAGYWRSRMRFSPRFHETLARWERSVHGPLPELRRLQRTELARLVERVRQNVPYYRDLPPPDLHPDDEEAIRRTLATIPPLEKESFREHLAELRARDVPRRGLVRSFTSGTTGSALEIWHTPQRVAESFAAVWRQRRACGVDIPDPYMTFGGQVIVPIGQRRPPFWRVNAHGRQTLFSIYHLAPHKLPHYVEQIHRTEARYVQGYPSALHVVGRALLDAGRPLPKGRLRAAFTSSESLLAFQREVIEEAFGAPVRDHYSATELVVSMTACAANRLHVDMEFCLVEVEVEEETEEWERGPLLASGLGYDVTPFLRYRIGDVGTRAKRPCPCGRPGDAFLDIDGRVDDYVVTPSGRLVGRLDHVFKEQWDVHEAQILQQTPDAITVLVVPRATYSETSQRKLLGEIRARLGDEIHVDVRLTDAIPREENGKFRAVKSLVGGGFR
jgi:phenylacetate-CoA ligase